MTSKASQNPPKAGQKRASAGVAPGGRAPGGGAPSGQAASGQAASGQAARGEAARGEAARREAAREEAASGEAASVTEVTRFLKDWTALWREELRLQGGEMEAAPFAGLPSGAEGMLEAWRAAMTAWAEASLVPPSSLIPSGIPSGLVPSGDRTGASRAKAAAVASDPRDAAIQRLIRRVDALETRLAKLEPPRRRRG